MSNKDTKLKLICNNDGEIVVAEDNLKIVAKKGLITKNTVVLGENRIEKIKRIGGS